MFRFLRKGFPSFYAIICSSLLLLPACDTVDLYEKVAAIPEHRWQSSHKPQFSFTIRDTAAAYQAFLIVRHNNTYRYNNLWVNLYAKAPADSAQRFLLELPLANKEGWLGIGMDDLFEHRIAFALDPQKFRFTKAGEYSFTLEHTMREDPLDGVFNVGFRLEKKR